MADRGLPGEERFVIVQRGFHDLSIHILRRPCSDVVSPQRDLVVQAHPVVPPASCASQCLNPVFAYCEVAQRQCDKFDVCTPHRASSEEATNRFYIALASFWFFGIHTRCLPHVEEKVSTEGGNQPPLLTWIRPPFGPFLSTVISCSMLYNI